MDRADPLYDTARQIVIATRNASIAHLQRRLTIGYNRTAGLIERMEAEGVVSLPDPMNGRRVVLRADAADTTAGEG